MRKAWGAVPPTPPRDFGLARRARKAERSAVWGVQLNAVALRKNQCGAGFPACQSGGLESPPHK